MSGTAVTGKARPFTCTSPRAISRDSQEER